MRASTTPRSGYASHKVTKAPNWHGLVAWDLLLNNLTTGLFLVAALGELARPILFGPLGKAAYPIALVVLLADLACLVFDLGDPLRFHHMLRVFKPSSPMSLGTWCLTVYSLPLTILAVVDLATAIHLLPDDSKPLGLIRQACLIGGLIPALGSAVYKGVLFSTSSQPAWKDARWLGGYLVNSAFMLGAAELLAIARIMGLDGAANLLKPVLIILLVFHIVPLTFLYVDFRAGLELTRTRTQRLQLGAVAIGFGLVIPLGLTLAASGSVAALVALVSLLASGLAIRWTIVMIPHGIE